MSDLHHPGETVEHAANVSVTESKCQSYREWHHEVRQLKYLIFIVNSGFLEARLENLYWRVIFFLKFT